jgi:hypothetical protein
MMSWVRKNKGMGIRWRRVKMIMGRGRRKGKIRKMSRSRKALLLWSRVKGRVHSQAHRTLDRKRREKLEKFGLNDSHLRYIDK